MTHRVISGWMFKPSIRRTDTNSFFVALEGVEDEGELPEKVKRQLKKEFQSVLRRYGIYWAS